ncbi:unnamed protein product [Mytilus coruscus]|uniref:Uncharacterized protein n=1 Tax=Mytilus coruscus TaxID=42192 RepID=A0A6J8EPB2_MYTCO|nr:unnamed protein product [Mytilus coruscus]
MDYLEKLRLATEDNNDIEVQKIRVEKIKEITVTGFYKNCPLDHYENDSLSQALLPTDLDPVMANCCAIKATGNGIVYTIIIRVIPEYKTICQPTPLEEVARHTETVNRNLDHLFTGLPQDKLLKIYDVAKTMEDTIMYEALPTCHTGNLAGKINIMALQLFLTSQFILFSQMPVEVFDHFCIGK